MQCAVERANKEIMKHVIDKKTVANWRALQSTTQVQRIINASVNQSIDCAPADSHPLQWSYNIRPWDSRGSANRVAPKSPVFQFDGKQARNADKDHCKCTEKAQKFSLGHRASKRVWFHECSLHFKSVARYVLVPIMRFAEVHRARSRGSVKYLCC